MFSTKLDTRARPCWNVAGSRACGLLSVPMRSMLSLAGTSLRRSRNVWRTIRALVASSIFSQLPGCGSVLRMISKLPWASTCSWLASMKPVWIKVPSVS
ncbi:hypothetical protein D3C76_1405940 [compost metagenome]